MSNCAQKVVDCVMMLSTNNIDLTERKNNLKNIIINHIEGNFADLDPRTDTNISMLEIIKKLEAKVSTEEVDNSYCKDILNAIVIGMAMIQERHIDLISKRGKTKLSEPIYSYTTDGALLSITILSSNDYYKTLTQVAKYFDNRFIKSENIRTLKIQ